MRTLLAIISISTLCLINVSCSKNLSSGSSTVVAPESTGIVGGKVLSAEERGNSVGDYAVSVLAMRTDSQGKMSTYSACTGSLIEKDLVLTAAHCLDKVKSPQDILVMMGEQIVLGFTSQIAVKAFVVHPMTKPDYYSNNDVALLRLESPAADWKKVVQLPTAELISKIEKGTPAVAVGYGQTQGTSNPSRFEEDISLRTVNVSAVLRKGQSIWAVDQRDGRGMCEGDSGGPLLVSNDNNLTVVGVAHSVNLEHLSQDLQDELARKNWSSLEFQRAHPDLDFCRDTGHYTAVLPLIPWILKAKAGL